MDGVGAIEIDGIGSLLVDSFTVSCCKKIWPPAFDRRGASKGAANENVHGGREKIRRS